MALNFPANPNISDTFTDGTSTWQWDGIAWNITGNTSPVSIPNSFSTISVAGQNDIQSDTASDTLTFVEGSNVTITTDASSDSITISSTASGGGGGGEGEANQNAFSNIAVAGQNTVQADNTTDTLNLVAGTNVTITTNQSTDSVTINATSSSTSFTTLSDTPSGLTVAQIYEPAIAMLRVNNNGTSAYTFDSHYSGNNPTITVLAGTTIAFDLSEIPGHPFEIQDGTLAAISTGLVHVEDDGTVSTGSSAQGKTSGVLYWRINESISGTYAYQCQIHGAMVGAITVKRLSVI